MTNKMFSRAALATVAALAISAGFSATASAGVLLNPFTLTTSVVSTMAVPVASVVVPAAVNPATGGKVIVVPTPVTIITTPTPVTVTPVGGSGFTPPGANATGN